jgi:hypothetical protein
MTIMKNSSSAPFAKPPTSEPGKPFGKMSIQEKIVYVSRVLICVLTFGLVFPNAFG